VLGLLTSILAIILNLKLGAIERLPQLGNSVASLCLAIPVEFCSWCCCPPLWCGYECTMLPHFLNVVSKLWGISVNDFLPCLENIPCL
jgi:hypothetical protein